MGWRVVALQEPHPDSVTAVALHGLRDVHHVADGLAILSPTKLTMPWWTQARTKVWSGCARSSGRARSRGGGRGGRCRHRACPRRRAGASRPSPSTRCASPGAPAPTGSPTRLARLRRFHRAKSGGFLEARLAFSSRASPRDAGGRACRSSESSLRRSKRLAASLGRRRGPLYELLYREIISGMCSVARGSTSGRPTPSISNARGRSRCSGALLPPRKSPRLPCDDLVLDIRDVLDVGNVVVALEVPHGHVPDSGARALPMWMWL